MWGNKRKRVIDNKLLILDSNKHWIGNGNLVNNG